MSSQLRLSAEQLLAVLHSPTGIDRESLLKLSGARLDKQLPEVRVKQPVVSDSKKDASRVEPSGKDLHKSQSLSVFWKLMNVSYGDTRAGSSVPSEVIADVELGVPMPESASASDLTLCTRAEIKQLLTDDENQYSIDNRAVFEHWYDCLTTAKVPQHRYFPSYRNIEHTEWVVIADYNAHLVQWWEDIRQLDKTIGDLFGRHCVTVVPVRFDGRMIQPIQHNTTFPAFGGKSKVIVASDCGELATEPQVAKAWRNQLEQWYYSGVDVIVLSPNGEETTFAAPTVPWGDHWVQSEGDRGNSIENTLACLATVQWCSWPLLRYWRRTLGAPAMIEYCIVQHPSVWGEAEGCLLDQQVDYYRSRFASLPPDLQKQLLVPADKLRGDLAHWVRREEALVRDSLGVSTDGKADEVVSRLFGKELSRQEKAWLYDLSLRQDARFWQRYPELFDLCVTVGKSLYGNKARIPDSKPLDSSYESDMVELNIVAGYGGISVGFQLAGNKLATINATDHVQVAIDESVKVFSTDTDFKVDGQKILLVGTSGQFEFERAAKPDWAVRIEQSRNELIATLEDDRRLQWCASGDRHETLLKGAPGAWIHNSQLNGDILLRPPVNSERFLAVMNDDGIDESGITVILRCHHHS